MRSSTRLRRRRLCMLDLGLGVGSYEEGMLYQNGHIKQATAWAKGKGKEKGKPESMMFQRRSKSIDGASITTSEAPYHIQSSLTLHHPVYLYVHSIPNHSLPRMHKAPEPPAQLLPLRPLHNPIVRPHPPLRPPVKQQICLPLAPRPCALIL